MILNVIHHRQNRLESTYTLSIYRLFTKFPRLYIGLWFSLIRCSNGCLTLYVTNCTWRYSKLLFIYFNTQVIHITQNNTTVPEENTAHKTTQTIRDTLHTMNTMQMQLINIAINKKIKAYEMMLWSSPLLCNKCMLVLYWVRRVFWISLFHVMTNLLAFSPRQAHSCIVWRIRYLILAGFVLILERVLSLHSLWHPSVVLCGSLRSK
jgi:hypothetical protein